MVSGGIQSRCKCLMLVCCSVPCQVPLWKLRMGNSRDKKEWLSLVAIASLRTHHNNNIRIFLKLYWSLRVKNTMSCSDIAEQIFDFLLVSSLEISFLNFLSFCSVEHTISVQGIDEWRRLHLVQYFSCGKSYTIMTLLLQSDLAACNSS